MPARTMDQWLEAYGESHQNPLNKLIHWFCVPGIFVTIAGLLWTIPQPEFMASYAYFNWASVTLIPIILFYFRLSKAVAFGMGVFSLAVLGLVTWYAEHGPAGLTETCWAFFVLFWIMQFVGHKIEGKKPSFLDDLQFLLIGPAWVIGFAYRKLGIQY